MKKKFAKYMTSSNIVLKESFKNIWSYSYVSLNRTMTKCRILHCCKYTNLLTDGAGFEQRRYREREQNPTFEPAAMGQALIKVIVFI